jgi:hypothetical protein
VIAAKLFHAYTINEGGDTMYGESDSEFTEADFEDIAAGCDVAAHEAVADRSEVSDAQALVEREDPREGSELGEDPY